MMNATTVSTPRELSDLDFAMAVRYTLTQLERAAQRVRAGQGDAAALDLLDSLMMAAGLGCEDEDEPPVEQVIGHVIDQLCPAQPSAAQVWAERWPSLEG